VSSSEGNATVSSVGDRPELTTVTSLMVALFPTMHVPNEMGEDRHGKEYHLEEFEHLDSPLCRHSFL
jgi:hypothetical protein